MIYTSEPRFALGQLVSFRTDPDVKAVVVGQFITKAGNQFKISWLHSGEVKEALVTEDEIVPTPEEKSMGFK